MAGIRRSISRSELANMRRLHDLASGGGIQRIPEPYPAFSTARVLTAEYLRGIPVSSVLRALRSVQSGRESSGVMRGVDSELYARRLMLATLTQIFRYQFFHADLHPGNLLVLPGNVVGSFVDFGLCDELAGRPVRKSQFRYFAAVYSGEPGRIFKALTEVLIPGELTDLERFHIRLSRGNPPLGRPGSNPGIQACRKVSPRPIPDRRDAGCTPKPPQSAGPGAFDVPRAIDGRVAGNPTRLRRRFARSGQPVLR